MKDKTYLIAAGGTGGHILPGIAIADKIIKEEPMSKILFCGTKRGMENALVKKSGYQIVHIKSSGMEGKISFKNVLFVINFILGFIKTLFIIKSRKIDVVIGTGGYVCGPVVFAGHVMRRKTFIHEQNAYPGKANLWLSKYATSVLISFESSREYFKKYSNIILTGNPVRKEFYDLKKEDARKILKFDSAEKIVFVTGGSLGAKSINESVLKMIKLKEDIGFKTIIATGQRDYAQIKQGVKGFEDVLDVKGYLYNQHLYMAACDLVVCRAGAITCSEVAILGKPSIMIPYPYAAGDHQTFNAKSFSEIGASVIITDSDLNEKVLFDKINEIIFDENKLMKMGELSLTLALPDAVELIYEHITL